MTIAESQTAAAEAKRRWYRVTPDRLVLRLLVVEGLLWLAERFGCFPKGYAVLLAVAGVAVAMLLMLFWFAAGLVFRWRFQFSIGSLLVLAVVVAAAGGWFAVQAKAARQQKEAVAGFRELASDLGFVFVRTSYDYMGDSAEPRGPALLRDLLGDDFFNEVIDAEMPCDAAAAYVRRLPRLETLTLWDVTDDGIENVKGLRSLRTLELSRARITEKGLRKLSGLTRLQGLFLSLDSCGDPDDDTERAADNVLKGLEALPQLRGLSLWGSPTSDAGLEHLKPLRRLKWLVLSGRDITDAGLEHLRTLTTLESLDIGMTGVTDAGLKSLKPLTRLKNLTIWDTRVTGVGLEELKPLPHLQRLGLDERQLTKASVEQLKALPQLRELEFCYGYHGFGDEHLKTLEELPQLESLDLVNPRTTPNALKQFESKMPRCKVNLAALRDWRLTWSSSTP